MSKSFEVHNVGDLFEVIDDHFAYEHGAVVELTQDDGSQCPFFTALTGKNKGKENAIWLYKLKPVEPTHVIVNSSGNFGKWGKDGDLLKYDHTEGSDMNFYLFLTGIRKGEVHLKLNKNVEEYVKPTKQEKKMKDFKKGTIVEVVDGNPYVYTITGCIGEIQSDGRFKILARSSNDKKKVGSIFTVSHRYLKEVVPAQVMYEPMTIELNTVEEFETMKAIMHLHNKVSGSSFFDLDWTPNSDDVRDFMKETYEQLDAHQAGWSKY